MIDPAMLDLIKTFASPLVALIAAGGAWFFAHAQVTVAKEQRAIAETQAKIADEKMRLDLFNKRFDIYVAFRDLLRYYSRVRTSEVDNNIVEHLKEKIDASQFLFDRETCEELQKTINRLEINIDVAYLLKKIFYRGELGEMSFDVLREFLDLFVPYMCFDEISPGRKAGALRKAGDD